MKKYIVLSFFAISYQITASQSYHQIRDLIRQNMSTVQHRPHDLTEYKAQVIFSREDVYGEPEEILQLSDAGAKLFSALTEQEKAKLPRILIATPGSYAIKFCSYGGRCKIITPEQVTVEDLDRAIHDDSNYIDGIIFK
jgi:hypothetical protein